MLESVGGSQATLSLNFFTYKTYFAGVYLDEISLSGKLLTRVLGIEEVKSRQQFLNGSSSTLPKAADLKQKRMCIQKSKHG
jgi:hypothetical protein